MRFAAPRRLPSVHQPALTGIFLGAVLALSGCAALAPAPPSAGATQSREAAPRAYHQAIDMNGRLSARYQQNGADQAVHGSFNWSQSADRTQVTLLSPLGQTLAAITVQPEKASLIQAGQPMREATDVDTLAASALGWPLPVSGLREWMQGFVTDANGRRFQATPDMPAGVLTSDGWRLTFANWQPLDNLPGQSRPKRIDLERGTMQAGDVSLRIVIDDWQPR